MDNAASAELDEFSRTALIAELGLEGNTPHIFISDISSVSGVNNEPNYSTKLTLTEGSAFPYNTYDTYKRVGVYTAIYF